MEPEGAAVLARDLAHLDEGQYDIVAEWMIEHGWTEPLDPVDAPVIPREVLLREIEDARNAGIRPAGGDELLAWNYLLDHFDQFVKGWPFRTSVPYPPVRDVLPMRLRPHAPHGEALRLPDADPGQPAARPAALRL